MSGKFDFAGILEKHRGEKHLVVLHDYPDPDAISCAFAHKLISARFGIQVDILYTGKISHSQNLALVKLIGIDLIPFKSDLNLKQYQASVFLDHQGSTVKNVVDALNAAGVPVLILVDHHEPQEKLKAAFTDIRKTGSTATIYTHHIKQGLLELQKSQKEHVALATALLHGILTDTVGFIRADQEDLQAAAFLSQFRDAVLLEQVMNQSRSKQVMDVIRRALGNRVV